MRFVSHDIAELAGFDRFDFVFSKPGGQLILGTSPLYYSAFGDHDLVGHRIPWLTALPEKPLFRFAAWKNGMQWRDASDAGLTR